MQKLLSLLILPALFLSLFGVVSFTIQGTAQAAICNIDGEYKEVDECPAAVPCDFTSDGGNILGIIPTWYKYLQGEIVSGKCRPVINEPANALPIGLAILELMMTLGGLVAVVMIFIGAFKYILSQGEPDKAKGAQQTVINSVVGLVIVIVATRIVSFIGSRLG